MTKAKLLLLAAVFVAAPTIVAAQDMTKMPKMQGPAGDAYMKAMMAMHEKMMSMKPTGDPDKDFVMMMMPHHQAAIDMAKAQLEHGKDVELKKMAQKIVEDQGKEISEMKEWQSKHGM
jgi:uncharacterized protein (DUF305 family)